MFGKRRPRPPLPLLRWSALRVCCRKGCAGGATLLFPCGLCSSVANPRSSLACLARPKNRWPLPAGYADQTRWLSHAVCLGCGRHFVRQLWKASVDVGTSNSHRTSL